MLCLDYLLNEWLKLVEVILAGHLAVGQPEIIEEAIICRWPDCQQWLPIVALDRITQYVSWTVPESLLIKFDSFDLAISNQWPVEQVNQLTRFHNLGEMIVSTLVSDYVSCTLRATWNIDFLATISDWYILHLAKRLHYFLRLLQLLEQVEPPLHFSI